MTDRHSDRANPRRRHRLAGWLIKGAVPILSSWVYVREVTSYTSPPRSTHAGKNDHDSVGTSGGRRSGGRGRPGAPSSAGPGGCSVGSGVSSCWFWCFLLSLWQPASSARGGTNTPAPGNAIFGTANTIVSIPGTEPHLYADEAAIRRTSAPSMWSSIKSCRPGRSIQLSCVPRIRVARSVGRPCPSSLEGTHGGVHQIALTRQVATLYDVAIGDIGAKVDELVSWSE